MLAFLRKLTLEPWDATAADVLPLREAGLTDAAVEEAMRVCLCFNTIDRLADAFDYELSEGRTLTTNVRMLLGLGYGAGVIPGGR